MSRQALTLFPVVLALALGQSACVSNRAHMGQASHGGFGSEEMLVGNVEASFQLSERGVLFLYADRTAGGGQTARNLAGDQVAELLQSRRHRRVALSGLSTARPDMPVKFDGIISNTTFSVFCEGHCKNLVLRMRGPGGRLMAAAILLGYPLPVIGLIQPTLYPATVSFEIDSRNSDLSQVSRVTLTQWERAGWISVRGNVDGWRRLVPNPL